MDWSTVIVSAGIGALVAALITVVTVSQVTVRQARAERAEHARQELRGSAGAMLLELRRYRSRMLPAPRRQPTEPHLEDYELASRLLTAAEDLSRLRRRLVQRRTRRIFGPYWTDFAELCPFDGEQSGGSASLVGLQAHEKARRPAEAVQGLLHRAYCQRPGHGLLDALDHELRRLRAGL